MKSFNLPRSIMLDEFMTLFLRIMQNDAVKFIIQGCKIMEYIIITLTKLGLY